MRPTDWTALVYGTAATCAVPLTHTSGGCQNPPPRITWTESSITGLRESSQHRPCYTRRTGHIALWGKYLHMLTGCCFVYLLCCRYTTAKKLGKWHVNILKKAIVAYLNWLCRHSYRDTASVITGHLAETWTMYRAGNSPPSRFRGQENRYA
jgi:hypothetical protein